MMLARVSFKRPQQMLMMLAGGLAMDLPGRRAHAHDACRERHLKRAQATPDAHDARLGLGHGIAKRTS